MKCQVCGKESGKYPLCPDCNRKKEEGLIIKCPKCNKWHYADAPCPDGSAKPDAAPFLYEPKASLLTDSELSFYKAILSSVPEGCLLFPQINLAAFIERTDTAKFRNELFRNVDFLITDGSYKPLIAIEINDQSHLSPDRKKRDERVKKICEEAGIPLIKLWTSYGVNEEYIRDKISSTLASLPVERVHHFDKAEEAESEPSEASTKKAAKAKGGCYIATCVYGSYDCPPVWTLRRFRDSVLARNVFGRVFIHAYYFVSHALVKFFGDTKWFRAVWKLLLDKMVNFLNDRGIDGTLYIDR